MIINTSKQDTIKYLPIDKDNNPAYQRFSGSLETGNEARQPAVRIPADKIYPFFGVYQCGDFFHVHLQKTNNGAAPDYYSQFIDSQIGKSWLIPVFEEADDILFCCNLFFEASSPDGELMVKADAIDLIEALPQIEKNQNFKYSKKLIEQIKSLKEDNNPVIVLFKLKNL